MTATAASLTDFADLPFAEKFAFSGDRAAVLESLRPNTKPWFVYSILAAEDAGRLDVARRLLEDWKAASRKDGSLADFEWQQRLEKRLFFLSLDSRPDPLAPLPKDNDARRIMDELGLHESHFTREQAVAPNTHPAALKPEEVSFDAFSRRTDSLHPRFAFLPYLGLDSVKAPADLNRLPMGGSVGPDAPGVFDAWLKWLKTDKNASLNLDCAFCQDLTLPQLEALQKALAKTPRDVSGDRAFAELVLRKLGPAADEDARDPAVRRPWLERILAFSRTLQPSLVEIKGLALYAILDLDNSIGRGVDTDLFLEYLSTPRATVIAAPLLYRHNDGAWRNRDRPALTDSFRHSAAVLVAVRDETPLVRELLAQSFAAGDSPDRFALWVESKFLRRVQAETALLSGVPATSVDTSVFSEEEFKALQTRSELHWNPANPRVFASGDDVQLSIEVKNVPSMHLAIYDLDAFAACRALEDNVAADVDLDGCVPSAERTLDYSGIAPVRRHAETLVLPELKKPGLYVVECSGNGISSRAVVRKGALRIVHTPCGSGELFRAFDESGAAVKGFSLLVGGTVFTAEKDETELVVPFVADASQTGEKTVVVRAGRLAGTAVFEQDVEAYHLSCGAYLPPEALVAGEEATILLSPSLMTFATEAAVPLDRLENPVVTVALTDVHGVSSVRTFEKPGLAKDPAPSVTFRVPEGLAVVSVSLSGTVANAATGKHDDVVETALVYESANGIVRTDRIASFFLRRGADGYRLELRGRTGEPIANREVDLHFRHIAFPAEIHRRLQTNASGALDLGPLPDIDKVTATENGHTEVWNLQPDADRRLPDNLHAAEGETFELPFPDLLAGDWPGADQLRARLSLVEKNAAGAIVRDRLDAASYANGVLRIAGLPAGDYELSLRTTGARWALRVTRPAKDAVEGGVLVGPARGMTDTGAPALPRIAEAVTANDALRIRVENAGPGALVHVFARRFVPNAATGCDGDNPLDAFSFPLREEARLWHWGDSATEYLSGRVLGDKLRYILERRAHPHRPGTMLDHPSLLLNPWSTKETATRELRDRAGEAWDAEAQAAMEEDCLMSEAAARGYGGNAMSMDETAVPSFDFLPEAAGVWLGLRPDAKGVVTLPLKDLGGRSDITVVLEDATFAESQRLLAPLTPFAPRDLRLRTKLDPAKSYAPRQVCEVLAPGAEVPRTVAGMGFKRYETVADAYRLLLTLSDDDGTLKEFDFVAKWNTLQDAEKRARYGKYACHELDVFLSRKDPDFFQKVVVPNLRNKRFPQFVDLYLLGEDLSAWTAPGRLDELNAFEQCLLALRIPAAAPVVERRLRDACETHRPDPAVEADRFAAALDIAEPEVLCDAALLAGLNLADADAEMDGFAEGEPVMGLAKTKARSFNRAAGAMRAESAPAAAAPAMLQAPMLAEDKAVWSNQAVADAAPAPARRMRRNVPAAKPAAPRQFYRPPERTKEWVETHYYRRRHAEGTAGIVAANRFWLDLAAFAKNPAAPFLSTHLLDVSDSFTECMAALAFLDLPFKAEGKTPSLLFREAREAVDAAVGPADEPVLVLQRYQDPADPVRVVPGKDPVEKYVADEFLSGRAYDQIVLLSNPSGRRRRIDLVREIPEGAIALQRGVASDAMTEVLGPYETQRFTQRFYFPLPADAPLPVHSATASEEGAFRGKADAFACTVVPKPTKVDTTSWDYVSQNGTEDEVLAFLRDANLDPDGGLDLSKAAWRFADRAFYDKAFEALDARGVFSEPLWRFAVNHGDSKRLARWLARAGEAKRLAPQVGPCLATALLRLDPEETDAFEHREFWPVINARVHPFGNGPAIPNEGLARAYREFLDVLAYKAAPDARDRVLLAVYLLAQDRIDEAKEQLALADAAPAVEAAAAQRTAMQLDYLRAYLAFCDGEPEKARPFATKWRDAPAAIWRDRFRAVLAQADEIAGRKAGDAADVGGAFVQAESANEAPTLTLKDAGPAGIAITSHALKSCTLRAYPMDIETLFSKSPFAEGADLAASTFVRPAWEKEVSLGKGGDAMVELPAALRGATLVLEAAGADGRASARLMVVPGALDVQVSRESGELRVRDANGKALAGAYVKVYVRGGGEVRFHKDGYTDLRGAFPYAAVSTDSDVTPEKFAILVLDDKAGGKTLLADPPGR